MVRPRRHGNLVLAALINNNQRDPSPRLSHSHEPVLRETGVSEMLSRLVAKRVDAEACGKAHLSFPSSFNPRLIPPQEPVLRETGVSEMLSHLVVKRVEAEACGKAHLSVQSSGSHRLIGPLAAMSNEQLAARDCLAGLGEPRCLYRQVHIRASHYADSGHRRSRGFARTRSA